MSDELLKSHRDAIDAIDAQILQLMNERANHAHEIGVIKGGGVVYRPEREAQVLARIKELNTGPLADETAARLFREIMSACLALERPLTIAYLGPAGTFSQAAAIKHFGHAASTLACSSIDETFRVVESGNADYAVVPVENSTGGAIGRSLDLMVTTPLKACGEVVLRIHQHFLRKVEGLAGVTRVYGHAQSLAQCHEWLNVHLPSSVERISVESNAEGARLASLDPSAAALAGEAAAEKFDLIKVAQCIEDEPNNTTRFLVMGLQDVTPSGMDKTALVISTPNRPGALLSIVSPLAQYGVSMTRFESRPSRSGLWEYFFFVDVEGHQSEAKVAAALAELQKVASFVKVLGSYPVAAL